MKFSDNAVLFEDRHVLAFDKPAGMLTQANDKDMGLEEMLQDRYRFLRCVHRIDRPVSGVVVFAKSSKALSRLSESLRDGKWKKSYRARVEGYLDEGGVLEHFLVHGHHRAVVDPEGKLARLEFEVTEHGDGVTFVDIDLLTGRYHQIRAQFAAVGHPICGDKRYEAKMTAMRGEGTIDLHHNEVSIVHPIEQRPVIIDSKLDLIF